MKKNCEKKKVSKVMNEYKSGMLKSSGSKVSNPKQAIAIALSESKRACCSKCARGKK